MRVNRTRIDRASPQAERTLPLQGRSAQAPFADSVRGWLLAGARAATGRYEADSSRCEGCEVDPGQPVRTNRVSPLAPASVSLLAPSASVSSHPPASEPIRHTSADVR